MNVVLLSLQVATQGALTSPAGLVDKVVTALQIRQMQIAAQAMIKSLNVACVGKINGLTVGVEISPTMDPPPASPRRRMASPPARSARRWRPRPVGTGRAGRRARTDH